jgi:hypothetical protein
MSWGPGMAVWIRTVVLKDLDAYEECVLDRMLAAFAMLDQEETARYDKLLESCVLGDGEDSSDAEQWASGEVEKWRLRVEQVQAVATGLFLVGLYHQFEQQAGGVADMAGGRGPYGAQPGKGRATKDLVRAAKLYGIDIAADFKTWTFIDDELRTIVNVLKHAEGGAANELRRLRPDLIVQSSFGGPDYVPTVERPMMGEGLHVTEDLFKEYAQVIRNFWEWLASKLDLTPTTLRELGLPSLTDVAGPREPRK